MSKFEPLDSVIHAPVRLAIMTLLITVRDADFSYLKEAIGATDGNLSTHLSSLEKVGYLKVVKRFIGRKPKTTYSITDSGRSAYEKYILALEQYINRLG